ncbi:zeta toxin family protein [Candidatus Parcubacteria bacterium]|nr:zeta toxin family protein [Candidatus Parcubacteria bacterium]
MDISKKATDHIKKLAKNKELYNIFANDEKYKEFPSPATIFMAGSPGAGKTEFSKKWIINLNKKYDFPIVRIDADEIRKLCPRYNGNNSHLFQGAVSVGVNKLYDYILKKRYNALLDSTFSSIKYAKENIERAISKDREVYIYYIYQDPKIAWEFTLKREKIENRKITIDIFVEDFFKARKNVNEVKNIFKEKVNIHLIKKDYNNNIEKYWINIARIDNYIKFVYTQESLYNTLKGIKL